MTTQTYLPDGLPIPVPEPDGLSKPYWDGLKEGRLRVQKCNDCGKFQWGPEYLCHHCHSFDMGWEEVEPVGHIYSWTRVWHPTHTALNHRGPYIVVVVELAGAGGVRMVGNLLGDAQQPVQLGAPVRGVFELHDAVEPQFALLQWEATGK